MKLICDFYDEQEEENRCAFIGQGDFILSDLFSSFKKGDSYYSMPEMERNKMEKRFYNTSVNQAQQNICSQKQFIIPGLDDHNHSDNISQKADHILAQSGVVPFAQSGSYHVLNSDGGRPHYVREKSNGEFVCDDKNLRFGCVGFNRSGVCSHTIAVAKFIEKLDLFVSALKKKNSGSSSNLTNISKYGINDGAGEKSGSFRKRKRDIVTEAITTVQPQSPLKKIKIARYNSEHVGFPVQRKEFTYPPPDDIVIAHKEQSVWRDRTTGVLRKSNKAANRYYHPNIQCVRKGNNGGNNSFSFKDLIEDQQVGH